MTEHDLQARHHVNYIIVVGGLCWPSCVKKVGANDQIFSLGCWLVLTKNLIILKKILKKCRPLNLCMFRKLIQRGVGISIDSSLTFYRAHLCLLCLTWLRWVGKCIELHWIAKLLWNQSGMLGQLVILQMSAWLWQKWRDLKVFGVMVDFTLYNIHTQNRLQVS